MKKRIITGTILFCILALAFVLREVLTIYVFDALLLGVIVLASVEMNAIIKKYRPNISVAIIYPILSYVSLRLCVIFELSLLYTISIQVAIILVIALIYAIVVLIFPNKFGYDIQNQPLKRENISTQKLLNNNESSDDKSEDSSGDLPENIEQQSKLSFAYQYFKKVTSSLFYPAFLLGFLILLNNYSIINLSQTFNLSPMFNVSLMLLILTFVISSATDIGAYFVGTWLKGPKLAPNISPKKTISGAIGGVVCAVAISIALYFIFNAIEMFSIFFITYNITVATFIFYGLFASIISQCGDLFASIQKRKNEVKDFGNIFPGHGGMLDRVDSIAFNATFTFFYFLMLFAGWFSTLFYVILAIFILLLMVTIHEFGHYVAGKMLGFKIDEFSVGFGKALYSKKKKNGELFSIRLIPLGGYCAFSGEEDDRKDSGSFNSKKPWKRLIVLFFGAFFNILSAVIFSIVLLSCYGCDIPQISSVDTQINFISQNNTTNLFVGDVVLKVEGEEINFLSSNHLNVLINKYALVNPNGDETLTFTLKRDGQIVEQSVNFYEKTLEDSSSTYVIGVSTVAYVHTFGEAISRCIPFTLQMAWQILIILGSLITGALGLSAIGGPITTISTMASLTQQNFGAFLYLLPLIAVNLGVFNLLPFPALDGSKMLFTAVEWVRGKPINRDIENMIHFIGLILLFGLVILADFYQIFIL